MKRVFISHSLHDKSSTSYVHLLQQELHKYGLQTNTVDDIYYGENTIEVSAQNFIKQSSLLLAVLTGEHANVFYEIGYAVGIGRPVLLIVEAGIKLPFDLRSLRSIRLDSADAPIAIEVIRHLEELSRDENTLDINLSDTPWILLSIYENDKATFEKIDTETFENAIMAWFKLRGHQTTKLDSRKDHGFDFELINYQSSRKTLVEVKKYNTNSKVSAGQVQQLMGAVYAYKAESGIFITTSGYTKSAQDFARRCSPHIDLWTMDDLRTRLG